MALSSAVLFGKGGRRQDLLYQTDVGQNYKAPEWLRLVWLGWRSSLLDLTGWFELRYKGIHIILLSSLTSRNPSTTGSAIACS